MSKPSSTAVHRASATIHRKQATGRNLKVFWRNAPLWQLWPQLLVLASLSVIFMTAARVFAAGGKRSEE